MIKNLHIDISSACNHSCNFCSNIDKRTKKKWMKFDNFVKICENISETVDISSLESCSISGQGEAILNKDIKKIVEWFSNKYNPKYFFLSTNGALLTNELSATLFEKGLDSIKISFNAFSREEYKEVHGVDDYDKVIKNIKFILDLKRDKYKSIKVLISSVTTKTEDEVRSFFNGIFKNRFSLIDECRAYGFDYTPMLETGFGQDNITDKCSLPFNDIFVNAGGNMVICCKDYFEEVNAGSLLTNDFKSLWDGQIFSDIRRQHSNLKLKNNSLCFKCLSYEYQDISLDNL
jgi:uncharacterized Fe-S cluster-containing radical SAM superfamily protein